jgi:ATP-binding cassette, subfamily B, bacterial
MNAPTSLGALRAALGMCWAANKWLMLIALVLSVLLGVVPPLLISLSQTLIDGFISSGLTTGAAGVFEPGRLLGTLGTAFAGLLVFGALTALLGISRELLQDRVVYFTQAALLDKMNTLDLEQFENPEVHDKLNRAMNESAGRMATLVPVLTMIPGLLTTALGTGLVLFAASPLLVLVTGVALAVSLLLRSRVSRDRYWIVRMRTPALRLSQYLFFVMTQDRAIKEVKLLRLERVFTEWYRRLTDGFYRENRALILRRGLLDFAINIGVFALIAGIAALVIEQTRAGALTVGGFAAFTQAIVGSPTLIGSLAAMLGQVYEAALFLQGYTDLMALRPGHADKFGTREAPAQPAELRVEGVGFRYPGATRDALKDVTLTIKPGERVALVGSNGAGKTTLIKLLTGLYLPSAGRIFLDGHPLTDYALPSLRRYFSVVFQDFERYQLTVRQNIAAGDAETFDAPDAARVQGAIARANAGELIDKLPEREATQLGKQFLAGMELSGGEWQKLALARAFMGHGKLLILDEPTSALDPESEMRVFQELVASERDRGMLLISHRFTTVRLAERIVVLEDGGIIEQGTHAGLLAAGGRYATLFGYQMAESS